VAASRDRVIWTSLLSCIAVLQACESPTADRFPTAPPAAPSFARATGPTVTAATPASARQGTVTLDVQITGSGYDPGSGAIWQLNGVPYGKIVVNSTTVVSSTSLIANITVAPDADPVTYDIAVVTSTGKKGIGAEMFTVTYAVPVPGLTAGQAINDAAQIVGNNGDAVVLSDPTAGSVTIAASGQGWSIDRNGKTIGGKAPNGDAAIWTSAGDASGPWAEVLLPSLGGDGVVRGIASDAAGDAVMLSGSLLTPNALGRTPTVWTRTASGWEARYLGFPAGIIGAWGQDINGRGQVAGMDGSGCCLAIYWDSLGAPTTLTGLSGAKNSSAWGINADGTMIVGLSGKTAVMWKRTLVAGTYGAWSAAISLESTGSFCGKNGSSHAYDVNAAGTVIVGQSCGIATAWKLSGGAVVQRVVLQGLGPPNQSVAYGTNELGTQATGTAKGTTGVRFLGY
jgi:uncharacterized membrane protein